MLVIVELWSKSKSTYAALREAHTWGCPAYVLDPKLQDGNKLPKWQKRSHMGQFVGVSSNNDSSVGLIRHLSTNNISPKFISLHAAKHFEL